MTKQVEFLGRRCDLRELKYGNGRLALELVIAEGQEGEGEPMAVATVNLPDVRVPDGAVFIKDYAENAGMMNALAEAGVIGPPLFNVTSGFVVIPCCQYLGGVQ